MNQDAFSMMLWFIHFTNDENLPTKGSPQYHPLQKVKPLFDCIQSALTRAWTLGKYVCVDESMIKYMGRKVTYVQYNPNKPIKHGVKVFCLCCAYTGVLHSFEIYTGNESTEDRSNTSIILRLLEMSGIGHIGRVLFTDNFYTSLAVMTALYTQYKMLVVGTMCLTKKKSRCQNDYPFHQMSNSALKKLNRGWMRTAITSIKDNNVSLLYKVQATVCKDFKQVAFLHNFMVGVEDNNYKVTRKDKRLGRYVYV